MTAESTESMAGGLADADGSDAGLEAAIRRDEANALTRVRALVWVVLTLALVLFLAVGSVPTHDGRGEPERVGITRIWAEKADTLPDVGHATMVRFFFFAAVALFMAAAIAGMGILLRLPAVPEPANPDVPAPPDSGEAGSAPGPEDG